jgi:hypothetical protein
VHFGMTSYSVMTHLIRIFETVKQIRTLCDKRENDPANVMRYERQIWSLYEVVSKHKDAYYKEKAVATPEIKNLYVTFRSMEGKQRAKTAYQ